MQMKLFELVDETIEYFDLKKPVFGYALNQLENVFKTLIDEEGAPGTVGVHSRLKKNDSLREKMIRNQFYLFCKTPQDVLENLHDLIGITMECRFIRNEEELYNMLFRHVDNTGDVYSRLIENPEVFLNLDAPQPQRQRNGFQIYRIDGHYLFNGEKINFELQIKSLVHNFWSEIEHEVVYKNPYFMMYDRFNRDMLGAIRDNLDIVDRQLEIMYDEITRQSKSAQIGMNEQGFKTFVARSINELVNHKMKDSLGFATDFKKCSAMISQYVFIRDFLNNKESQMKMIEYMGLLNVLKEEPIDFKEEISLGRPYSFDDPFSKNLGMYFEKKMNTDFQWHVFFAMLFLIQPGNNLEDFVDFIAILKSLVIQPEWYKGCFILLSETQGKFIKDRMEVTLSTALCDADTIEIVHEDKLFDVMNIFHDTVNELDNSCNTFEEVNAVLERTCSDLYKQIRMIFK